MFFTSYVSYRDMTIGARLKSIRYEPGNLQSLAAACRELSGVIGAHAVANLMFSENTWNMPGVGSVFEAAPALKYAEDVGLTSPDGSTTGNNNEAFVSNFVCLKSLRLWLDYAVFRQLDWTFLCQDSAHKLRHVKGRIIVSSSATLREDVSRSVEDIVRYYVASPRLQGREALELDFSRNRFSAALCLRIIEILKGSGREFTFRTYTPPYSAELVLDESDYTVFVDNTTTRYASDKDGIVVEVRGCSVAIQSTAVVPRKKLKRC